MSAVHSRSGSPPPSPNTSAESSSACDDGEPTLRTASRDKGYCAKVSSRIPALLARLESLEQALRVVSEREDAVAAHVRHVSRLVDECGARHGSWDTRLVHMLEQDTRRSAEVSRKQEDLAVAFGIRAGGSSSPLWRAVASVLLLASIVVSALIVTPLAALRRIYDSHRLARENRRKSGAGQTGSGQTCSRRSHGRRSIVGTERRLGSLSAASTAQSLASSDSHSTPRAMGPAFASVPSAMSVLACPIQSPRKQRYPHNIQTGGAQQGSPLPHHRVGLDLCDEHSMHRGETTTQECQSVQPTATNALVNRENTDESAGHIAQDTIAARADDSHSHASATGASSLGIEAEKDNYSDMMRSRLSIDRVDVGSGGDEDFDDGSSAGSRNPSWAQRKSSSSDMVESSADFWVHFE
jgi:hypothetical protein